MRDLRHGPTRGALTIVDGDKSVGNSPCSPRDGVDMYADATSGSGRRNGHFSYYGMAAESKSLLRLHSDPGF